MSGVNTSTAVLGDKLLKYSELCLFRDLFRCWELGSGKGGVQGNGEDCEDV